MTSPLRAAGAQVVQETKPAQSSVDELHRLLLSNSPSAAGEVKDPRRALELVHRHPTIVEDLRHSAGQLDPQKSEHMMAAADAIEAAPDDALSLFMLAALKLTPEQTKKVLGVLTEQKVVSKH